MFASIKMCFEVWRDGTPNTAAHRSERESGSHQSEFDPRMPCGNRRYSLADRELHRKRQVPRFTHYVCKIEPGFGRQPEPAFGRLPATQCRAHRTDQKGAGEEAEAESIESCGYSSPFRRYKMVLD